MGRLALLLLVALVPFAGCLSAPAPEVVAPAAVDPVVAAPPWTTAHDSGEVLTTLHADAGAVLYDDTFTVPDGTGLAWFNLTFTGVLPDEVVVRFDPPTCVQVACPLNDRPTQGGRIESRFEDPAPGVWQLVFIATGPVQKGTYELDVTTQPAIEGPAEA
jgi:hypothetical protein